MPSCAGQMSSMAEGEREHHANLRLAEGHMIIEVCRVTAQGWEVVSLRLPPQSTVWQALEASGWLVGMDGDANDGTASIWQALQARRVDGPWAVSIYGRRVGPDEPLHPHDRVELLAPVLVDPMVARQRRAEHRRREAGERRWARDRDPRLPRRPPPDSSGN